MLLELADVTEDDPEVQWLSGGSKSVGSTETGNGLPT
jgi:hypothetical protein